jgi:hypothetical protein
VSPKSFLRRPKRKRKPHPWVVFVPVLGFAILLAVGMWAGFRILNGSAILSPLPAQLGKILPQATTPSEKEMINLLQKHHIGYTTVTQGGQEYVISLNEKQQVIFSRKKDLTDQISSLQIMLPRLTMEEKQFKRLDLRYDKPVVVY